ncbi:MAG: 2'-deoxycytidine 5'-triphosphate deaminase [Alphaproteobacteria bacterium]|nr:2'-deoxycytidine 5'-triphosphate deaminase [Alphaproteobacteria bacterium]
MILSGSAIAQAVFDGDIVIDPFVPAQVGPNSYDFRLGNRCKTYISRELDVSLRNEVTEQPLPEDGLLLLPGTLYLINTMEVMGSFKYVPIIRGRSSTGRLGLFINVTADLIDLGSINQWTLQLSPVLPVRVLPGMLIGQVTFWTTKGIPQFYSGKYRDLSSPVESHSYRDFEKVVPHA